MGTIKSGSLAKRSGSIFTSWSTKHCILYSDGDLSIYENVSDATPESHINVRTDCEKIEVGFEIGSINLPKNISSVEAAFCIITKKLHKKHYFCAENDSECRQWFGKLENARKAPPLSKKVPMAPMVETVPPPAYAPPAYSQPLSNTENRAVAAAPPPQMMGGQPPYYPGGAPQPVGYGQPPMGYAPQPYPMMYPQAQPMYGQPMYGQPVYVSQSPQVAQQQQQRSNNGGNNNTRNMLLAGGGGLLGGYMLGSAMSNMSHHHYDDHHHDHDMGGGGGGFDDGGFDF